MTWYCTLMNHVKYNVNNVPLEEYLLIQLELQSQRSCFQDCWLQHEANQSSTLNVRIYGTGTQENCMLNNIIIQCVAQCRAALSRMIVFLRLKFNYLSCTWPIDATINFCGLVSSFCACVLTQKPKADVYVPSTKYRTGYVPWWLNLPAIQKSYEREQLVGTICLG